MVTDADGSQVSSDHGLEILPDILECTRYPGVTQYLAQMPSNADGEKLCFRMAVHC